MNPSAQTAFPEPAMIAMSAEAKAMIDTLGDEMGARYFRKPNFEAVMRPSYLTREPHSELPSADGSGKPLVFRHAPQDRLYGSNHVYAITPEHPERIVLYVHGGAYVHNAAYVHAQTCDLLAGEMNAEVILPMYTLAPQGTWEEAFALLDAVWADILKEDKPVIIMGDSAGGGLALAFAEKLAEAGGRQPEKLVLLSPWVDVTMSNPDIAAYEDQDVSLAVYGLAECGKMWAGKLALTDSRVSPIYFDDWQKLPETLLFTGTAQIFYPDVLRLFQKLCDAGVNTSLVTGTGLFHVFPVYTNIPESTESRSIIKWFVEG